MKKNFVGLIVVLFLVGMVGMSNAAIMTYTDKTTWESLVGSIDVENFNDAVLNNGLNVTLSVNGNIDNTVAGSLYDDLLTDERTTTFSFDTAILEFAGDTIDLTPGGVGSGIEVTAFYQGGGTETITDLITADNGFWGFISDTSISEVVFYDVPGDRERYSIDNLAYSTQQPIPEPATMLLFGTGLAGLVGSRIRRKK